MKFLICLLLMSSTQLLAAPMNRVDILWVIDNSASMGNIQENVSRNASSFMQEFLKGQLLDWKMGIVTTDDDYAPTVGFSIPLDRTTPDPLALFSNTVRDLGVDGSSYEHVFFNIEKALNHPSHFLRSNSHLAVIMVTDEEEQSSELGAEYKAAEFYKKVRSLIPFPYKVRFYGALSARELDDCLDYSMVYTGSAFEEIINLSDGLVISACQYDYGFGSALKKISKDIASSINQP